MLEPDLLSCAKGMGNGFPLGGCILKKRIADELDVGIHGSTYSGNPLGMVVGNAVLDILLEKGFLEGVRRVGRYMGEVLRSVASEVSWMGEVRGIGCMWGIDICGDFSKIDILEKCINEGLLVKCC